MKKQEHHFPKYICYLSNEKVDNLYSQISTIDVNRIQTQKVQETGGQSQFETPTIMHLIGAGMSFGMRKRTLYYEEGQLNYVQKFRSIVSFCHKNRLISNLNQVENQASNNTPILYSFSGKFTCDSFQKYDKTYFDMETAETDRFIYKYNDYSIKTIGQIVILKTNIDNRKLYLACSTQYFSDMGASLWSNESNEKCYKISPHSGNYFFFDGTVDATFEAIFILNGQKDGCLFGSPVALFNDFSSSLII